VSTSTVPRLYERFPRPYLRTAVFSFHECFPGPGARTWNFFEDFATTASR